jgi:putative ABC transport system permease protein
MKIISTSRVAVRALLRNKMRAFLTTLGIVIGVAAVIAMVAIGEGAKQRVKDAFATMGTNLLVISSGSTGTGGARGGYGSSLTLTWDDLQAIQTQVPAVKAAAPTLSSRSQIMSDQQNWSTQIVGTTLDYFDIRNWQIAMGDRFSQADQDGGTKVVILGQTVVDKLYGENVNPVGQAVRIKNIPFQIVGVLSPKGQSPTGQDYDDVALVPVKAFQTKIQGGLSKFLAGQVYASAVSSDDTSKAEAQIKSLLRDRHRLTSNADDDFQIRNLAEVADAQAEGTRTLTTLLASIAGVALLVGGIGIMNIMLVSVTERTREIGVRMAVGAKPHHILLQFLTEALLLSIAGGALGVAIGVGAALELAAKFQWSVLFSPTIMVIAVVFSAGVGIVFGLYPARKASQLDPINALRYE